jgi:hypothetical protein
VLPGLIRVGDPVVVEMRPAAEIAAVKQEPGPDVIAHDGASFAAAHAAQG